MSVLLLLLVGGSAMALLGSGDVHSEVPQGWAVATSDDEGGLQLVPEGYANQEVEDSGDSLEGSEASSEEAQIFLVEDTDCKQGPDDLPPDNSSQESWVTTGYDTTTTASNILQDGQSTVAGHAATWTVGYTATAWPWVKQMSPVSAADYPDYLNLIFLDVCVEDLGLGTRMYLNGDLSEPSREAPEDEPTSSRNATVPEAREEVHEELRRRYEANVGAMTELLESVETTGWDGSTDLSSIPTSLDGIDEALSDPFKGQLEELATTSEDPDAYDTTEPTTPETTTPSSTQSNPDEEALEEFGREYDAANRSEDWEETYSLLEEEFQKEFTEEEWVEKQQALREVNGIPAPLESVTVQLEETMSDAPGRVSLYYEDGTQEDLTVTTFRAVDDPNDDGGPRLILSDLQVSYLRGVPVNGNPETTTPESTGTGDLVAQAEEAAGDYYRAAGIQDWDYTYDALDSETQALFTRDEWSEKNQYLADNGEVIYHVDSVYQVGTNDEYFAVTLKLTYEDGSSSTRETYFVLEGEEWKHRFSQEETDLFGPGVPFEEWVDAQ